jgi:hypothetical protein
VQGIALDGNSKFLHNSPSDSAKTAFPLQLHEQTQRFILLLIFYLFGPILTLGIIGGVVVRKLPSNARSWERSLTQQTGLHWTIQSVEYRSPGCVRLHNVKILNDPVKISEDTAQDAVFTAPQIDIRCVTNASRSKIFPGISASPTEHTGLTDKLAKTFPSLYSSDSFWQITVPVSLLNFGEHSGDESALLVQNILRKIFARFSTLSDVPVQFAFEEIAVISEHSLKKPGDKNEDKVDIFRFVQGNIYRTSAEIRSDWSFQIKDVSELDWEYRERLSFVLSLPDTFEISFQTGRQPIPCDLAAVFCSRFKHFSGGSFEGKFSLSTRSENNSETLRLDRVIFNNVPLAPLVGPYTNFAVEGTVVDLRFSQVVFGTEGTYAEGCLQVQNGAVERTLLHRCIDHFQLRVEPGTILDSPTQMIPFSACAIHFRLQPEGIDFWADNNRGWNNAIMYYHKGNPSPYELVIFVPDRRRIVSYHELMSIFAVDGAPVVPLTSGSRSLVPYIPVQ